MKEILRAVDGPPALKASAHEMVCVMEDIAIVRAVRNAPFEDALYTGAILSPDGWRRTACYSASAWSAMLTTLGHKHLGPNSQFGYFASRMLNPEP